MGGIENVYDYQMLVFDEHPCIAIPIVLPEIAIQNRQIILALLLEDEDSEPDEIQWFQSNYITKKNVLTRFVSLGFLV